MATWRTPIGLLVALCVTTAVQAQTHTLIETPTAPGYFRQQLDMKLTGTLKVQQEGKTLELKQTADATHAFLERVLVVEGGVPVRSVRHYQTAKVVIAINGKRLENTLRPERAALIVAQRHRDQVFAYSPKHSLTRDELHVTEHFDTLSVTGLLPQREVKVGETWKIGNATVQALCNFEGLTNQSLAGKLESVEGTVARLSVTGTVSGVDLGADVKVTIDARLEYDLTAKRLTKVEWKQSDARTQGPVSPAGTVDLVITLVRTAIEQPMELNDAVLPPIPDNPLPPEDMKLLSYGDPKGRYDVLHTREWQLVGRTEEHLVMRLMDRGEFVAQVTVTPWKKMPAGKHLSGPEFEGIVPGTPGWESEAILKEETKEIEGLPTGNWAYRVASKGRLEGVEVLQYFYLLAGPQGEQLVLAFTMKPGDAQKLDTRDLNFLRGVTFPGRRDEAEVKGR